MSFYDGLVLKLPAYGDGPTVTLADLSRMNRVRQLLSEVLAAPVSGSYTNAKPTASSSSTCTSSSPSYNHQQYGMQTEYNQNGYGPYSASHQQNTTSHSMQYIQSSLSQGEQCYQHPRTPGETVNMGAVNAEPGDHSSFSMHHPPPPLTSGVGLNPSLRGGGQRFGSDQGGRGGSKRGEDDHKKVNIDESTEIHEALVQMLQRCNEDVDNHELEQSQRECKVLVLANLLGRGYRILSR